MPEVAITLIEPGEKITEREKSAVSALVEEYKVKWQQILLLDAEVKRWTASYIIGIAVGIYWVISSDKLKDLPAIYSERKYDNSYFILSIAVINAMYILALTLKGYQIQQIQYYLHTITGKQISKLIEIHYNSFEVWRRSGIFCSPKRIGKSEWRRTLYYSSGAILPAVLSISLLWMYIQFVLFELKAFDFRNIYFYCVIIFHIIVIIVAASTADFNRKWEKLTLEEFKPNIYPPTIDETISKLLKPFKTESVIEKKETVESKEV